MLRWRLLLGTILIAMCVALFWLDGTNALGLPPAAWIFPLVLLVSVLGTDDLLWLYSARDWHPPPSLFYAGNLAIVLSTAVPIFWGNFCVGDCPMGRWGVTFLTFAIFVLLAFVTEMRRYREPGKSVLNMSLLMFGWCYVGMLLCVLLQLRILHTNIDGILAVATLILFVKLGDTGAYTIGRIFGKHKMTPTLSPGKTWEGAIGAVVWAAIGGFLVWQFWLPEVHINDVRKFRDVGTFWNSDTGFCLRWMIYAVIIAISGMFGDLAESLIKRDLGRKDSSNWVPGFGGVLDILDSILFVGPVAYICWLIRLVP